MILSKSISIAQIIIRSSISVVADQPPRSPSVHHCPSKHALRAPDHPSGTGRKRAPLERVQARTAPMVLQPNSARKCIQPPQHRSVPSTAQQSWLYGPPTCTAVAGRSPSGSVLTSRLLPTGGARRRRCTCSACTGERRRA